MRKHPITQEEKIAKKLYDIVNNLDTNLDWVGYYLARIAGQVHANRFEIIYEAMKEEKEKPPIDTNTLF